MAVSWDVTPCGLTELYRFRGAYYLHLIITLMMEAAGSSEMSVYFYQTTQYNIPEDSHLHTRRYENLISHLFRK
jgi:hypothetical protein